MGNILLTIHLILALLLISAVLLQRSEGGGFGTSSANNNAMLSGRSAATAMTKVTWILALAFLTTSIALTIISAKNSSKTSIIDGNTPVSQEEELDIPLPDSETLKSLGLENSPTLPPVE